MWPFIRRPLYTEKHSRDYRYKIPGNDTPQTAVSGTITLLS